MENPYEPPRYSSFQVSPPPRGPVPPPRDPRKAGCVLMVGSVWLGFVLFTIALNPIDIPRTILAGLAILPIALLVLGILVLRKKPVA